MQDATNCMAKCVHTNTVAKQKRKDFLYLSGMGFTDMK